MNDQLENDGEGFMARWSRKKTEERLRQFDPNAENVKKEDVALLREETADGKDNEERTPIDDLPDIDNLNKDSDYTPFLKDGVPKKLKRLALRKLWMSDPAFGVVDGLDDYAEDFSAIGIVAQEILTNYKPGKGMIDPDEPKEEIAEGKGTSEPEEDTPELTDATDNDAFVKGSKDPAEHDTNEKNEIDSFQDNSEEEVVEARVTSNPEENSVEPTDTTKTEVIVKGTAKDTISEL